MYKVYLTTTFFSCAVKCCTCLLTFGRYFCVRDFLDRLGLRPSRYLFPPACASRWSAVSTFMAACVAFSTNVHVYVFNETRCFFVLFFFLREPDQITTDLLIPPPSLFLSFSLFLRLSCRRSELSPRLPCVSPLCGSMRLRARSYTGTGCILTKCFFHFFSGGNKRRISKRQQMQRPVIFEVELKLLLSAICCTALTLTSSSIHAVSPPVKEKGKGKPQNFAITPKNRHICTAAERVRHFRKRHPRRWWILPLDLQSGHFVSLSTKIKTIWDQRKQLLSLPGEFCSFVFQ